MGLFKRIFGKRETPEREISFSRGPKSVDAQPGTEDATFLREAAVILRGRADEVDLTRDIQAGYGCDELEVMEFAQIAEDIWGVSLIPNPFWSDDAERAVREFRTLADIIKAAKAKSGR